MHSSTHEPQFEVSSKDPKKQIRFDYVWHVRKTTNLNNAEMPEVEEKLGSNTHRKGPTKQPRHGKTLWPDAEDHISPKDKS